MTMKSNAWTIVLATVTLAVLVANAQEDNDGLIDSSRSIITDSMLRVEFLNKPALSANARKARAIDPKLSAESQSSSRRDSRALIREPRSAEDGENNDTITTTSLPLENDDARLNSDANSASPVRNASVEEEVDSRPIKSDDPESSEKDKAAGDNGAISSSNEMSTVADSSITPTPDVAPNDETDKEHSLEQADQPPQNTSTTKDVPAIRTSSEAVSDITDNTKDKAEQSSSEASEHQAPPSEDVEGKSVPDLEVLQHMHPDLATPQDTETQSSTSSQDVNGSAEQTASEAPVSVPASEAHEEEADSVSSSSLASSEKGQDNAQDQPLTSDSDVSNNLETTTLISVVDLTPDGAPPAEKTSSEVEATENNQHKESDNDDLSLSTDMKSEANSEETSEAKEDEPTEATFDEPTDSPAANGEWSEEVVPNISSVVPSSSTLTPPTSKYDFVVYDKSSNVPCVLAAMTITLRVTYATKDKKTQTKSIQVPSTAFVRGSCEERNTNMTLSWPVPGQSTEDTVTFTMKKDDSHFFVSNIQVRLVSDNENFPNAIDETVRGSSAIDLRLFAASLKSGEHVCQAVTEVTCGPIVVLIKDVSLVAYNDRDNIVNREEEHCSPAPKSVSIAAVIGGVVGLTVTIGIVASYAWYKKRTNTFRSELP